MNLVTAAGEQRLVVAIPMAVVGTAWSLVY